MAKGISELDAHQAADDIVATDECPTVERIRAYLGAGPPNTVTRWLETRLPSSDGACPVNEGGGNGSKP